MLQPSVLPGRAFQTVDRVSRCHFNLRVGEGKLDALTGQAPAFARASAGGSVVDVNGRLRTPVHSQPRFELVDLDGDGVRETPLVLIEPGRTNLFIRVEEFNDAAWSKGAGCTVTPDDTRAPSGAITADKLDFTTISTDNFAQQQYTVADPENRTFVFSIFLKDGTLTEAADRFSIQIRRGDASEISSYTIGAGTLKVAERLGNGWTRYYAVKTFGSSTTGDNVQVLVRNQTVTGYFYAWGAQLEEAPLPSSYIATAASTVARLADDLSYPFLAFPQAMTAYARFVERGAIAIAANPRIFQIGGGAARFQITTSTATGQYGVAHNNGVTAVSATLASGPSYGQLVELRAVLNADGSVLIGQSINGGAESLAGPSAALALASAWSDQKIWVGEAAAASAVAAMGLFDLRVAGGARTLQQMRELL